MLGRGECEQAMPIIVCLSEVMKARHVTNKELAGAIGISAVNISKLRAGSCKAIKFSTLSLICSALYCQPGDILRYQPDED